MKIPSEVTLGDKYGPAMEITDQAKADEYFEKLVDHTEELRVRDGRPVNRESAAAIERINLGYYAGYYDNETRERVERLFKCSHTIFGSIAKKGPPTAIEAFESGLKMGRRK